MNKKKHWRNPILIVLMPYIWMIVFFLFPLIIIFKTSFSSSLIKIPPISDLISYKENGLLQINLNLSNYLTFFTESFYLKAFLNSIKVALISTTFCLVIGFSIAYSISKLPKNHQKYYLLLVVLPFWTSFLIRVYSWMGILSKEGFLNTILLKVGIISMPISILNTDIAVIIGLVYCYLPFMILPLYSSLEKADERYIEAANDLGCHPTKAFWKITIPLSKNGIIAGCMLVFVPSMGEFVIPELLGGADNLMMGRVIWIEFFNNRDWPISAALSIMMVLIFILPFMAMQKIQNKSEDRAKKLGETL